MQQSLPVIQFSHANGMPAATYQPLFEALLPYPVGYVPYFGMGDYPLTGGWQPMVDELIRAIEASGNAPVVGIGHSLGGVLTLFAAQQRPELFRQLIFLDPPMFGLRKRALLALVGLLKMKGKFIPPAKKTRNRREHFPSREEALAYFKQRAFFKAFDERALHLYVQHGLRPEGEAFTLTLARHREYEIFLHTPTWLGKTTFPVPTTFIHATQLPIHDANDIAWLKRNFSKTTFIPFEGTHMFPLEQPARLAEMIKGILGG